MWYLIYQIIIWVLFFFATVIDGSKRKQPYSSAEKRTIILLSVVPVVNFALGLLASWTIIEGLFEKEDQNG